MQSLAANLTRAEVWSWMTEKVALHRAWPEPNCTTRMFTSVVATPEERIGSC
jgi:hypothetical protein